MARKPSNYWEKRSTELMLQLEKDTRYTINELIEVYKQSTKNINKEIENIFKNYAKDGVLKKETLKQLLNKKESDLYYKNILKTIDTIQDDTLKKQLYAKYNAPAYSFRISRLQALQNNIDVEMKKIAELEQAITKSRYVKTIEDGYYHTMFDIQKGIGLGFNFSSVDMRVVNLMLSENWVDNKNFSKRIWNNTEKLGNYLKIHLTADTMTGKSISKTSKELAEYMNVGLYNSSTLVRTEVNHFANEASMLAYEECEIDKYQFIATLDNRTCDRCGNLDNKIFNVKDKKVGINYPPIHPNDRCTTISYFDDETMEGLTRRARDENGKSIKVPADMNYKSWSMQYAPEIYKKYYINPNLPKIKSVEDNVLDIQLSFYEEDNGHKMLNFIPKNAIINNVHIIAGKGTQTIFRSANKYANEYGGNSDEWTKKVGKIESSKYIFDVHWVEHKNYGKYDFKLKGRSLK